MTTTELHYLSATEALLLFRSRQLSPVELAHALIARAELVEPEVNAFAERLFDEALAAAGEAEARYARGRARPLDGLLVVAKEEQALAGHDVTDGTLLRAPARADETSELLDRVETAGGIVHARSTTSEFCCVPLSHTLRWGITRNPWNLDAGAGGSSTGSAASLAAGTATLATGSDIGGSLRVPASFNGVVSFKPPHGRNPVPPALRDDTYYHSGPMARTVADCALLQNVMAAATPLPEELDPRGLRVAFCPAPGDFPVDPEVGANTRAAALAMRGDGVVVEEVDLDWRLAEVNRAYRVHSPAAAAGDIIALAERHPDMITPYALAFARASLESERQVRPEERDALEARLAGRLDALFDHFDVLVVPTVGATALAAGEDYVDTRLVVDGVELEHFTDAALTELFNIASHHPVLAVPSGCAGNGIPTGVQVVARADDDLTAFRVAAGIERTMAWAPPANAPRRVAGVRRAV